MMEAVARLGVRADAVPSEAGVDREAEVDPADAARCAVPPPPPASAAVQRVERLEQRGRREESGPGRVALPPRDRVVAAIRRAEHGASLVSPGRTEGILAPRRRGADGDAGTRQRRLDRSPQEALALGRRDGAAQDDKAIAQEAGLPAAAGRGFGRGGRRGRGGRIGRRRDARFALIVAVAQVDCLGEPRHLLRRLEGAAADLARSGVGSFVEEGAGRAAHGGRGGGH
mmetsp:Transcript_20900/g.70703  ORF Transcript_20900/g.70703 Transcript_20900/m.70703 type:complete len:228 (+) Transcript_20900:464-1147(+)